MPVISPILLVRKQRRSLRRPVEVNTNPAVEFRSICVDLCGEGMGHLDQLCIARRSPDAARVSWREWRFTARQTFNVARTENLAANPAVDFCSIWNKFLRRLRGRHCVGYRSGNGANKKYRC